MALLKKQPRDIVFTFCQYGDSMWWEWGDSVGAILADDRRHQ